MSNDTVQQRINQCGGIALTAPIADAALKGPEQKPILPVEVGHGLTSSQCHYPKVRREREDAGRE